ncbi:MAG: DNA mismatch repair protein [Dolichospermum sp. DEX189]|jgi:hypothetical protein|nr:DNA mismatch repair protein [Dolichospermum sp. DEX189]
MSNKYFELAKHYLELQQNEAAKSNLIGLLRIFFSSIVLVSIYVYFQDFKPKWIIISVSAIVIFIVLIKMHRAVVNQEKIYSCLKKINEDEDKYIQYGYLPFDNGEEYISQSGVFTTDLDILGENSLFQHVNRTQTFMGKKRLYEILVTGVDPDKIVIYNKAIQELAENLTCRQQFTAIAMLYPDKKEAYLSLIEWSNIPANSVSVFEKTLYYIFPAVIVISISLFLVAKLRILVIISCGLFFINLFLLLINYKNIKHTSLLAEKAYRILDKYSQLIRLIELEEFSSTILKNLKSSLISDKIEASKSIKYLASILEKLETMNNPWGLVLLNGLFLYHVHSLVSLNQWKFKYSLAINSFLNTVYEFDALVSLANFTFNNPEFIYPKINYEGNLSCKDLSHPLINRHLRISSDVSFDEQKFILLTGSNMSGKSTFLRAIGMNIVLAKAGLPVCSSEANIFPFKILSSIRKTDSLKENESYFFAELKSLKLIIDSLQQGDICFIILDEILRGTNSEDKRIGTIALIEKLIKLGAMGVIATHDLEVCEITDKYPKYLSNKCFEVEILNNQLSFDYKLRNGICKNTSASFLMKKMKIIG